MIDFKTENYEPGELLKITPYYESNYPSWKVAEGTIVSVKKFWVSDISLGKEEKSLFRGRYGLQKEYPIFSILLKVEGQDYLVSQLGFNKDGT